MRLSDYSSLYFRIEQVGGQCGQDLCKVPSYHLVFGHKPYQEQKKPHLFRKKNEQAFLAKHPGANHGKVVG